MTDYEIRAAQCAEAGHIRVLLHSLMRWQCSNCLITWNYAYDTPEDNPRWRGPRRIEPAEVAS